MFRIKRARSLIQSIAHHGVSALSYLHPQLGEEAKKQSLTSVEIDLINGNVIPAEFAQSDSTRAAISALKERFYSIAEAEGINKSEIAKANIVFGFEKGRWPSVCWASITGTNDKVASVKVDGFGKKHHALSKYLQPHS